MVHLPSFFATAGYDKKTKSVVLKATNCNTQPVATALELHGAATVGAIGRNILLRADQLTDENSLDNPRRLVPREQPLPNCAKQFTVILPPLSVNVLTIPVNRP